MPVRGGETPRRPYQGATEAVRGGETPRQPYQGTTEAVRGGETPPLLHHSITCGRAARGV